ncbi:MULTISPECIES: hypothetical protein [Kamptonema]|uniref:hypothetical protein n=1 Tax=Kamptonema TaxID=1501433 RepID=UPI0001DAD62C|nr:MULTISPECIES: hypothetical protein [Kamptonema]CBN56575.1 putative membrane protein [Kamptonema sp. PCC 6506]
MNFVQSLTIPTNENLSAQWRLGCRSLSQGIFWQALLITVGSLSNLTYTCTLPFVCLGVIAGTTLTRRRAIVTATTIWFANQLCGYTLHNYPRTFNCFAWGLVLLTGTLLVTMLASYKPLFSQGTIAQNYLRMGGRLTGGFVLFELVILLAGLLLEGKCVLTLPILWSIFAGNVVWLSALAIAHGFLVWEKIRTLGDRDLRLLP